MKFFYLILVLSSLFISKTHAEDTSYTREKTLRANQTVADDEINIVGSKIVSKDSNEELVASCEEYSQKNECLKIHYILKIDGINYVVHSTRTKIVVNLELLQDKEKRREYKDVQRFKYYLRKEKYNHFLDFNLPVSGTIAEELDGYYFLALLPISVALDLLLLPATFAYDAIYFLKANHYVKMHKKLSRNSKNDMGNVIKLNQEDFDCALETLSHYSEN